MMISQLISDSLFCYTGMQILDNAATKIQKIARGKLARQIVAKLISKKKGKGKKGKKPKK